MPKYGFTKMFNKMLDNKKIKISLNTDFYKIREKIFYNKFMIYTGEPDRFFDYKYGKLDWRSLIFKFKIIKNKSKNVYNITTLTILNLQGQLKSNM